jgi:hypothetical protein
MGRWAARKGEKSGGARLCRKCGQELILVGLGWLIWGAQGHCTALCCSALSPVATEALAENPVGAKPEP